MARYASGMVLQLTEELMGNGKKAGYVMVPKAVFDDVREFVKNISEDQYTDGVPWQAAERLLKRIDAALEPPK